MPPNQQFDVLLDGRGFMLARGKNKGRAWRRTSTPSVPGATGPDEARYSTTAPNLRFKEVFDDFSGGFGYGYRTVAPPNGVHWSENLDTRYPGQAVHCQALLTFSSPSFPPNIGGPLGFYDLPLPNVVSPPVGAGAVALVSGVVYTETPRPNGTWRESAGSLLTAFARRIATFGSFHHLPVWTGNYQTLGMDGITFTTQGSVNAQLFVNAGNRLWRAFGAPYRPIYLSSVAAGASAGDAASWSATLPVGNGNNVINDLAELNGQVFCGLADGIYAGDQSGTFVNVTGQLAGIANADNFRDLCVHDGMIVGNHVGGIYAYTPTTTAGSRLRQVGPVWRSNRSPVHGYARCVKGYAGWLYAGLWTGSASYVLAGRDQGDGGPFLWTVMQRLPNPSKISLLHFDGITAASGGDVIPTRMWVGTDLSVNYGAFTGTQPVHYAPIPRLNGNPLVADPVFSANYAGSARLALPAVDRGAPGVTKVGEAVEVWADGFLSGSRYADVYYTADRGTRTLLGRAQTSPVSTLLMGSTNGSFPLWRSLEVELESFNTTPGTCQVYRSVVLTGNLRPDYVETIEAVFAVADDTPDRRGTPMRPASVQIDDLRDFCHPLRHGNVPHQLLDLAGATSYVVFDGMPNESETYQEGSENAELLASVTMVVLTLSQNTQ